MKDTKTLATAPAPAAPDFFPRRPAETPRAFAAFLAYFQLGPARSLPAVADKLGENPGTVKNWSSKFDWADRLQDYHSGILQAQARDQAALQLQQAADWNRRLEQFREQEWEVAQQLLAAARCFLETFGDDDLRRMSLSQVSRAMKIASGIARSAMAGADLPVAAGSELSPLQQQLLAGVARVFGPPPAPSSQTPAPALEPRA